MIDGRTLEELLFFIIASSCFIGISSQGIKLLTYHITLSDITVVQLYGKHYPALSTVKFKC